MILLLCLTLGLQVPGDAATPDDDGGLVHEVRRAGRRVEQLLDARFESMPAAIRAPAEVRRVAGEIRLAKVLSDEALAARGRAWEDIGLGNVDSPSRVFRILAEDLEGVAVDPARWRLLVDPDRLTAADFAPSGGDSDPASLLLLTGMRPDEPLIVHALVHLLDEQEHGDEGWPATTDEFLALRAWREGQANLAAVLHVFAAAGVGQEVFSYNIDPGEVMNGALIPVSVDSLGGAEGALLDWVYRDGYQQAADRFRAAGPAGLRKAMATRPTTRDVRHLDRAPLGSTAIPEPALVGREGLRRADRDSVGEEGIVALVTSWTGKANLGLITADGWGGDALFRWEDPQGTGVTLWITRWVSEKEAADFQYGYLRAAERRFPSGALEGSTELAQRFEGSSRIVTVSRDGREVRVRVSPKP